MDVRGDKVVTAGYRCDELAAVLGELAAAPGELAAVPGELAAAP